MSERDHVTPKRTCERAGCTEPHKANGLCHKHYNRERDRTGRERPDRVLACRARGRAVAALIKAHPGEYAELLTEATASVHEEHLHLAALAAEAGLDPKQGIVRLRKGPRPTDQEVEDRIDLSVTSSCDACASFHRTDHSCSSCEDRTWQAACQVRPTSTPLAKLSPEQRIERALRAGKSARWIADNLAEPIQLILRVLDRLRSENWS